MKFTVDFTAQCVSCGQPLTVMDMNPGKAGEMVVHVLACETCLARAKKPTPKKRKKK